MKTHLQMIEAVDGLFTSGRARHLGPEGVEMLAKEYAALRREFITLREASEPIEVLDDFVIIFTDPSPATFLIVTNGEGRWGWNGGLSQWQFYPVKQDAIDTLEELAPTRNGIEPTDYLTVVTTREAVDLMLAFYDDRLQRVDKYRRNRRDHERRMARRRA